MTTLKNQKMCIVLTAFFTLMCFTPLSGAFGQAASVHEQAGGVSNSGDTLFPPGSDRLAGGKGNGVDSQADHFAEVFEFEGDVRVLKHDREEWVPAQKGMTLEVGDQILTGKDSHVDIHYDEFFLNIARIEEKTKAEFRSIEPTDLHMEDGTIFSALDGLEKGSQYQISTPTAVAGVRGTHLFTEAEAGHFTDVAVTIDQKIEIDSSAFIDVADGSNFLLQEGEQIHFEGGEAVIQEVAPEIVSLDKETMETVNTNFGDVRAEGKESLGDSGDDKPADKPNDGGDGGGAENSALAPPSLMGEGLGSQGPAGRSAPSADSELSAALDHAMDAFSASEKTGIDLPLAETQHLESEGSISESSGQGTPTMDPAKMQEFLNLGQGDPGKFDQENSMDPQHMLEMMTQMGFSTEEASTMLEHMETMSYEGFNPNYESMMNSDSFSSAELGNDPSFAAYDPSSFTSSDMQVMMEGHQWTADDAANTYADTSQAPTNCSCDDYGNCSCTH